MDQCTWEFNTGVWFPLMECVDNINCECSCHPDNCGPMSPNEGDLFNVMCVEKRDAKRAKQKSDRGRK
jgi:hypothetical protein